MIRRGFVMSVHPGREAEYARRHAALWPELRRVLLSHGVSNYSIFLHSATHQLFAYVEFQDESQWDAIAETEECRRWWQYMAEIMPHNEDRSPRSVALQEVFHLF